MTRLLILLFGLLIGPVLPLAAADSVTVFAAASLRGALDEIADLHDTPVALSFGGSGAIARQVAGGAPADVIVLANREWMAWLASQGHIKQAETRVVAQNRLVVVGPAGSSPLRPAHLPALLGNNRLAMGQRDAVPAGTYAMEWLKSVGLWQQMQGSLAETDNVRAALALVVRGQAPYGVVYATDARATPEVAIVHDIPPETHSLIAYPAAALTPAGQRFMDLLLSDAARAVFIAHGYAPVAP